MQRQALAPERRKNSCGLSGQASCPLRKGETPLGCYYLLGCSGGIDCDAAIRSAAVFSACSIAPDFWATTCCAVFTNPDATCTAADLISGSDAILRASVCTARARSSSDFWSSGDGLNDTESSGFTRRLDVDGEPGCWERAAEVVASPIRRTNRIAMRFIGNSEVSSRFVTQLLYPTIAPGIWGR